MIDDFSDWLEQEHAKEKANACMKHLKDGCYGCPFEESCDEEELLNSLEEW